MTLEDYAADQRVVIDECVRVLKPGGSICWQVGNHISKDSEVYPLDIALYPIFKAHTISSFATESFGTSSMGFIARTVCQDDTRRFFGSAKKRRRAKDTFSNLIQFGYLRNIPTRSILKVPTPANFPAIRSANSGDVWYIPNVKHNHVEKEDHPCQFPVELIERLVLALTRSGDTVLDPYMGAGSTAVAAAKHGRVAIGCDVEQKYVAIARGRLERLARGELKTRPMQKAVYRPSPRETAIRPPKASLG